MFSKKKLNDEDRAVLIHIRERLVIKLRDEGVKSYLWADVYGMASSSALRQFVTGGSEDVRMSTLLSWLRALDMDIHEVLPPPRVTEN